MHENMVYLELLKLPVPWGKGTLHRDPLDLNYFAAISRMAPVLI